MRYTLWHIPFVHSHLQFAGADHVVGQPRLLGSISHLMEPLYPPIRQESVVWEAL